MTKQNKQGGFTLVEMSIVLVIIGLIVGGVLVGQDLIKAARIRAVVAQIQGYDTSINAFMGKYDDIPGDISQAVAFGLGGADGDGDGVVENGTTATFDGELDDFWLHLSAANMADGSYAAGGATAGTNFPRTKLKKGGVIAVMEGSNLTWVLGTGNAALTTTLSTWVGDVLTPAEAFGIDSKLDDGKADTGSIVAISAVATIVAGAAATFTAETTGTTTATDCLANTTDDIFRLDNSANACTLKIRSSSGA